MMRKRIISVLLVTVILLSSVPAMSAFANNEYVYNGWRYTIENKEISIIGYNGTYQTVNMPDTITDFDVTKISAYALRDSTIKTLMLSERLKEIDENAFTQSSVTSVYIPATCTKIADSAFEQSMTIYGFDESLAKTYAQEHGLTFVSLGTSDYLDSYVGKTLSFSFMPEGTTLQLSNANNTLSGMNIKGTRVGNTTVSVKLANGILTYILIRVKEGPASISNVAPVINLFVGDTYQMSPEISNGVFDEAFTFSIGDRNVARIDENGLITALNCGSTVVTVTYPTGLSAKANLNVGLPPEDFKLDVHTVEIGKGEPYTLTHTVGKDQIVKKVYYESSNEDVVSITGKGIVQSKRIGVATITATTTTGATDTCVIIVGRAPKIIRLATDEISMAKGEKVKFKVYVDTGSTCSTFIWRSDDPDIADIDQNGVVTGVSTGVTRIYAYTYNYKSRTPYIRDYATVYVQKAPTKVTFNVDSVTVGVGEDFDLNMDFASGYDCYERTFDYTGEEYFSVGKNMVLTGLKVGKGAVTVTTFNGVKGSCPVTVKPAPEAISCRKKSFNLSVGQSCELEPYVNTGAACSTYYFESSDTDVATVNRYGVVTAKSYGKCKIYVSTYNSTSKNPVECAVSIEVGYITNVLEYYTTYFDPANYGKSQNLKMVCKYINGNTDGYILQPGEVFSFNDAVGPRTYSRGFADGYVISGGGYVLGVGGGICQASSTIFNAALFGNLKIVERWEHSLKSSYVPVGRDATVCWGVQDFRFKNNYDTPLRIKMNYDSDGVLNCTIYSLEEIDLPWINLYVNYSSGSYRLRRFAGNTCNYIAYSTYSN